VALKYKNGSRQYPRRFTGLLKKYGPGDYLPQNGKNRHIFAAGESRTREYNPGREMRLTAGGINIDII